MVGVPRGDGATVAVPLGVGTDGAPRPLVVAVAGSIPAGGSDAAHRGAGALHAIVNEAPAAAAHYRPALAPVVHGADASVETAHPADTAAPPDTLLTQGRPELGAAGARPWIAWQVPSRAALAATPPSPQRALLRDAMQRTLEANGVRVLPRDLQVLLAMPESEILTALEEDPSGAGLAADLLRERAVPLGRRRGPAAAGRRV